MRTWTDWRARKDEVIGGIAVGVGITLGVLLVAVVALGLAALAQRIGG
jgi:threonine/homoserine/homoserine lactone efflux protein